MEIPKHTIIRTYARCACSLIIVIRAVSAVRVKKYIVCVHQVRVFRQFVFDVRKRAKFVSQYTRIT